MMIESAGNGLTATGYGLKFISLAATELPRQMKSAKGDVVFGVVTGGVIKFGQCYGIAGWAENDIIHKCPHQQNAATMRGFNMLIQRGVRQARRIKPWPLILYHNIRTAGGYTIFDADMFIAVTVVAMLNGIGKCFINGKFKGKKITVGKCISLALRKNGLFNFFQPFEVAGNFHSTPKSAGSRRYTD